jgi:hypothetical protein
MNELSHQSAFIAKYFVSKNVHPTTLTFVFATAVFLPIESQLLDWFALFQSKVIHLISTLSVTLVILIM